jgi:hypothetical protein
MPYNDLQHTVLLTIIDDDAKSITEHKGLSSIGFMFVLLFSDW